MLRRSMLLLLLLPVFSRLTTHDSRLLAQEGGWKTEGYGYYLEFRSDSLLFHEITAVSCLPSYKATKVDPPAGARAAYRMIQGNTTFVLIPADGGTDAPPPGRSRVGHDHRPVVASGGLRPSDSRHAGVELRRLRRHVGRAVRVLRPEARGLEGHRRGEPAPDHRRQPAGSLFAVHLEHDRAAARRAHLHRRRAEPAGSAACDAPRTFSSAPISRPRTRSPRSSFSQPVHKFCNGQLEFSMVGEDIGYLRLRSFSGYHADGFEAGLNALEAALDTIFAGASAVARDGHRRAHQRRRSGSLRTHHRLTPRRRAYLAYTKEAASDPIDPSKWTPGQDSRVTPSTRPASRAPSCCSPASSASARRRPSPRR